MVIVTFVCTANICRSAFAELVARRRLADAGASGVEVHSAGTWGLAGRPMCPEMAAEAIRRGAEPAAFRARRLDRALVERSDLLLTAEAGHRAFVLDEWPAALRRVFTLRQFADALGRVPAGAGWAELLAVARRTPPGADVRDPVGRGPAAAAACAGELDALLDAVLPGLVGPYSPSQ